MTPVAKHYTSREIFKYFMGWFCEAEAADLERHMGGCEHCLARARQEYRTASAPAFWLPRAPQGAAPVTASIRVPEHTPERASWFAYALIPAAAVLIAVVAYVAWNISRAHRPAPPTNDPVVASLRDNGGKVTLTRSGRIALEGVPLPADFSAHARDLLTTAAVSQPRNLQLALAATRDLAAARGSSRVESGAPIPLAPLAIAVRSTRPTFSWVPVAGAEVYSVYIRNRDHKDIWRGSVERLTSLVLPESAPGLLRGGIYRWQVEASVHGEARLSGWNSFVVLDDAGLERVTAGEKLFPHSALLLGALYEAHGLYPAAEEQFRRLAALNPLSPLPGKMLETLQRLGGASPTP